MAIVYGPFPAGINVGYLHYDVVSHGQFLYLGEAYNNINNWLLVGGVLNEQPDTSLWGVRQNGARWFNSALGNFFGWNGVNIVILG